MANFLITTPNSLTQGTDTTDLFVLNTALGTTVNGGGGADQFSATVVNASVAAFNAGFGNDSVYLTSQGVAVTVSNSLIALGNGSDLLAVSAGAFSNSTIIGGGGNDSINLVVGSFNDGSIYGGQGSDYLSATTTTFARAVIAAGGDADTISLQGTVVSSTIRGGGGADRLTFQDSLTNTLIYGDDQGESQFFGNDTINFSAGTHSSVTVLAGGGADQIIYSPATLGSGNIFQGAQGGDTVSINTVVASAGLQVLAGAGNDSIYVSAALASNLGTLQGGGGIDTIDLSATEANGGIIFGGAGADFIELGIVSAGTFGSGAAINTVGASGVAVGYQNFSDSNLAGFDIISAQTDAGANSGASFTLNQSAGVNFSAVAAGTYIAGGQSLTVAANARVTTFAAGTVSLTARATVLDSALGAGGTVLFQAGGANYLFVQGGSAGSGTSNDLIVQLNVGGFVGTIGGGVSNGQTGGLFGVDNNNIKIGFTSATNF
jgi:hypothetical protein